MTHDFSLVFDTDNEYWQRVLDIFEKNEKYEKKVVSNRNLHHKFPRSFSKILGEPVDNDKDNLISLSLADHFLVHYYYYLLARKGYRQSMATAFTFMAKKGLKYMTPETAEAMAKDYEEARAITNRYHSEAMKGKPNPHSPHPVSEETKAKLKVSMLGKNKGKHVTDEMRKYLSDKLKGRTLSDETKQKIRESKLGHKHTEETLCKLRDSHKGLKWYNDGKNNVFAKECPEGFVPGRLGGWKRNK